MALVLISSSTPSTAVQQKQGNFLPGTHIPIHHPDRLKETRPDFVLVLPWNLINEIKDQMSHIRHWGGRFVVPIPEVKIHS